MKDTKCTYLVDEVWEINAQSDSTYEFRHFTITMRYNWVKLLLATIQSLCTQWNTCISSLRQGRHSQYLPLLHFKDVPIYSYS